MSVVYGVLVVCGACFAAIVGLALVQRLVPAAIRKEHNDVAGNSLDQNPAAEGLQQKVWSFTVRR